MKTLWRVLAGSALFLNCSCDKLTDYSPYDANTEHSNLNALNIAEIQNTYQSSDSVVFVAISDTHTNYSDLRAAVTAINQMQGISFAVVCGDVTNLGLYKEFDDYYHLISRLAIPAVTLIGNHDYLSNGKLIFTKMFGPTNFYFDIGDFRFVAFDNVVWENGNRAPDFDWLQETLAVPDGITSIACYHINPGDFQLGNGHSDELRKIIETNPVSLSIFGHGHSYKTEEINNRTYLMLPEISKRSMARISLSGQAAAVKMINF